MVVSVGEYLEEHRDVTTLTSTSVEGHLSEQAQPDSMSSWSESVHAKKAGSASESTSHLRPPSATVTMTIKLVEHKQSQSLCYAMTSLKVSNVQIK